MGMIVLAYLDCLKVEKDFIKNLISKPEFHESFLLNWKVSNANLNLKTIIDPYAHLGHKKGEIRQLYIVE